MSAKAELLGLAEKVEAGNGPDFMLRVEVFKALPHEHWLDMDIITSIDATEALRERLLPGLFISVDQDERLYRAYFERRVYDREEIRLLDPAWSGEAPTEARARLAALLRAHAGGM